MRQISDTIRVEGVISEKESVGYSRQLSAAMRKKRALESEKKSYVARIKSDLTKLDEEIEELTDIVDSNRAIRDVDCTIEYDFDGNKKKWLSTETGEVVRTTAIPEDELNEELPVDSVEETPEDGKEGMESNE